MNVPLSVVENFCLIGWKSTTRSLTFLITGMVFSDWLAVGRRQPEWWREGAYAGTKLLYQPALQPIVYIVPVTDILGRPALVPYGEHGLFPMDGARSCAPLSPRPM